MEASLGLLLISAIVGSFLGVAILFCALLAWHYSSTRKTTQEPRAEAGAYEKVASNISNTLQNTNQKIEDRRRSSLPSNSFDLLNEDQKETTDRIGSSLGLTMPRPPSPDHSDFSNAEQVAKYICQKDFIPRKKDDCALRVGDVVTMSMTFTDGWAHGSNLITNQVGMYVSCILVDSSLFLMFHLKKQCLIIPQLAQLSFRL